MRTRRSYDGREIGAAEQRVLGAADTRPVFGAAVVGERSPLGAHVDHAVAHDQPALRADHVPRVVVLHERRVRVGRTHHKRRHSRVRASSADVDLTALLSPWLC